MQLVDEDEPVEDDVEEEPLRRELRSLDQHDHDGHDHRPQISAKGLDQSRTPQHLAYSAPSEDDSALAVPAAFGGDAQPETRPGTTITNADDEFAGVGRNALCPCGSGKKYKRCHGAPGGPTGLTARING
ncbi:SEC-C metal-binding domain-containing protein [Nocardioides sp.]|uniref:SEC-C metal-binding domain-containing protein n=1 Tax=Nocardioides sp. TaxID=35761 RepID=UPI0039C91607